MHFFVCVFSCLLPGLNTQAMFHFPIKMWQAHPWSINLSLAVCRCTAPAMRCVTAMPSSEPMMTVARSRESACKQP